MQLIAQARKCYLNQELLQMEYSKSACNGWRGCDYVDPQEVILHSKDEVWRAGVCSKLLSICFFSEALSVLPVLQRLI